VASFEFFLTIIVISILCNQRNSFACPGHSLQVYMM